MYACMYICTTIDTYNHLRLLSVAVLEHWSERMPGAGLVGLESHYINSNHS